MEIKFLLIPILGFIIGYFTNYLAIKMLFHPRRKIVIFHGLIPKRKKQIARKISDISPEIMPPIVKQVEHIPIIGKKIIKIFKRSVENRINSLSAEEIEEIILKVAKKELRFITVMGGVIGFLIGCAQLILIII